MEAILDMAKVTTKGQITIPIAIRRALGVNPGDRVLFVDSGDGSIVIRNAAPKMAADTRPSEEPKRESIETAVARPASLGFAAPLGAAEERQSFAGTPVIEPVIVDVYETRQAPAIAAEAMRAPMVTAEATQASMMTTETRPAPMVTAERIQTPVVDTEARQAPTIAAEPRQPLGASGTKQAPMETSGARRLFAGFTAEPSQQNDASWLASSLPPVRAKQAFAEATEEEKPQSDTSWLASSLPPVKRGRHAR